MRKKGFKHTEETKRKIGNANRGNKNWLTATVDEAIDDIHTFLDCDMWSKCHPGMIIGAVKYHRQDYFKNEKDFREYLEAHFNILRKEIKRIRRKHVEGK
jgi:hypothetical protein